jgi:outer membrane protein assembly factor BamB
VATEEYDDEDDVVEAVEVDEDHEESREAHAEKARRQLNRGRLAQLSDKLTGGPERPGQQKIARSPVVLLLAGSTVGASILAAIFWFINARNQEDRLLKEATTSLETEKYLDAEGQFERFIKIYPKTSLTGTAKIGLYRSRVEKYIMTKTPDVVRGLAELKEFIKECRELEGFDAQKDNLKRYADRLTFAGARVAEVAQLQEALDVSLESLEILRKYSGEEGIPSNREQELINRQRMASASVAKKVDFLATLSRVEQQLEVGDTMGAIVTRGDLIRKYPLLENDKDVTKLLQGILSREKEFVVRTDLSKDGLGPAESGPGFSSYALTLRTQATGDLSSQGRAVFAVGMDSCYAVDADTGTPIWRQVIGANSPFAPMPVKLTDPAGVLVYNTLTSELQLLSQKDGQLVWRQPLDSRPTGTPVLIADNFYVTTEAGELWQVAAISGRAIAKLKFSQKVIGPPAVSSDSQRLVIPGDQTLVYTIGINPFACMAVSHIPHLTGSIKAPMIAAGRYYLMCDNNSADRARIQTLQMDDAGQLSVVAQDTVDGQVNDPCLLRGYELFVPSTPQRVTAFRVTDDAGQPPLAKVGANQLEEGLQTKMFLLAGPGGQLWMGGRSLRKFQTRTNTVLLDAGVTAEGIHVQPIQFVDESVFLTSRNPTSTSVFFTRADREQMKGTWRTVIGSRLVAVAASAGGQSLLAVADYGEAYRAQMGDIQKGGFGLESVAKFRLPDKLTSSVEGLVLNDGRPAAWCGATEPSMWTFTNTGQLERKWTLPDAPQVPPVAIDGGVVFAMPGRLHISATAGGKPAEDYRSSQSQDGQQPWKSLTAISANQVLAVTGDNSFVRVEYRASPKPQLAEVSVTKIPQIIEVPPAAANGFLCIATVEGKLLLMQASSLEILAEADLGGVPSAAPKMVGEHVFVEVAGQDAKVFHIDNSLPQTGLFKLDGHGLAGPPLAVNGGFLAARTDGLLMRLDASGAATETTRSLGQALQQGPLELNGQIIVIGFDGSLYIINPETLQ